MEAHKAHLMRRLILETSADSEIEEFMVEKLRVCSNLSSGFIPIRLGDISSFAGNLNALLLAIQMLKSRGSRSKLMQRGSYLMEIFK